MDAVEEFNGQGAAAATMFDGLIQASRMDVLIHVLALEQHVGSATVDIDLTEHRSAGATNLRFESLPRSASAAEFFEKAHRVDWLTHSTALTNVDHQTPVVERAQLFLAGDRTLSVRYAPGGQLVDGAVDAALSLFFGQGAERELGTGRPIDRSINSLRDSGWSHGDLRALLHKWAVLDPSSAIVLLKFADDGYAGAHHELVCRYDIMHAEYDFLTADEGAALGTDGSGSTQTLFLRAEPAQLSPVLDRCREAVFGSYLGEFSVLPISVLWSPTRQAGSNPGHSQRLRKIRRQELVTGLVDRARGR